jgi:predicted acyltransferase
MVAVDVPPTVESRTPRGALPRIASVDAYRGFVMFLMLAEVLRSCVVAAGLSSPLWSAICAQQTHAGWVGLSLHDLIQPSFYFIVGIGLVFSLRHRRSAGQSRARVLSHTIRRSLLLIVLGMAVVSVHPREWTWVFTDTLAQIGLAYPFLFLIALRPRRVWYAALAGILVGYWLWFALTPPPADFDYAAAGVPPDWLSTYGLTGFQTHWQKNSNVAVEFDRWLLNRFPRDAPYAGDWTGLATLNFIPSIGTMILGLLAGTLISSDRSPLQKLSVMGVAGAVLICAGWTLGTIGVCPVVKAIWTPSWVLFSGGWCFLLLFLFYSIVDVAGFTRAAFALIVIGANSIVAYCMSHAYPALAFNALKRIVGNQPFRVLGDAYEPFLYGVAILSGYWLVLYVLYRRQILLRI